eukprot:scaffold34611_cov184-Amphora_coffeaeformis.AAC.1
MTVGVGGYEHAQHSRMRARQRSWGPPKTKPVVSVRWVPPIPGDCKAHPCPTWLSSLTFVRQTHKMLTISEKMRTG